MTESDQLRDVGRELAEYSSNLPYEEPRSRSEVLFPYLLEASKRMSTRQISAWLNEKRGISFSAAAVSKVLRNQERYFRAIITRVQPLAEHVAHCYGLDPVALLSGDGPSIGDLHAIDPKIVAATPLRAEEELSVLEGSIAKLRHEWCELSEEARSKALQYFEFYSDDEEDE